MAVALSYRWGRGKAPPPSMAIAYYQGDPSRPGSLIITQLRDRCEAAAPVDGHSIIVQMGDGAKLLPRRWPQPTTRAIPRPGSPHYYPNGGQVRSSCSRRRPHIIVQMGDGAKLLPRRWPQLTTRAIPRPGSLIITQMGDRCEAAAPVDGHSIIVQMGDGAKLLPRRWPQPTTRAIPRPGSLIITQMGDRCEAAAPVDGHSLLPGRSLALVVSLLPNLGTGTKWLLPSMAVALSYRWGTEQSPVPHLYHKLDYNPETKAMISS